MDPETLFGDIATCLETSVALIIGAVLTAQIIAMILLLGIGQRGKGCFMALVSSSLLFLGFCWGVVHFTQS